MKKPITLLVCLAFIEAISQQGTEQANLDKYWKYREMLKSKFVMIGDEPGASIPMACRIPGYAYGGTADANGTQLQWKDATITLGYYLMVLGTEVRLLKDAQEPAQASQKELYFALEAIDRIDLKAEEYLSDGDYLPSLNGFLLRDDVPYEFWQNWANDGPLYPDLFVSANDLSNISDPGNPNRSDSDYNGLDDATGTEQSFPSQGNAESLDQLTSLLTGLLTVFKLVDDELVQPTLTHDALSLKQESKEIALRLIHYVMKNAEPNSFTPIFKIQNQDGELVDRGFDCTGAAWPLLNIALEFGDESLFSTLFDFIEIPIMIPSNDLYASIAASNAPCMNTLQQNLHDLYMGTSINEPVTICHIPLGLLMEYIELAQNENLSLHVGSTDACHTLTLSDVINLIQIDLELPGLCEDIVYDILADYYTRQATR